MSSLTQQRIDLYNPSTKVIKSQIIKPNFQLLLLPMEDKIHK